MKNCVISGTLAGAAAFAGAVPASASAFDLSLASGLSPYTVTRVGAGSYVNIGGTTYAVTGVATYAGHDQKAHYPTSSLQSYVDCAGISVSFGTGDALNLFAFSPASYGVAPKDQNASGGPFSGPYYSVTVSDPPGPVSAPEGSTLALMLAGFAGFGFVAMRKRKTPAAALD
jgi:hypothetical protein